jgi:hypothetical protein
MSDDTKWTKEPWFQYGPQVAKAIDTTTRTVIADCAMRGHGESDANAARIVSCVNLLSAHPDLTRVAVVGEGVAKALRTALELAAVIADLPGDKKMFAEALALLPSATVKE